MSAVVEVEDLTKHYGRMQAVDGVSFSLEENRIHGLLGRNGAGKTTLMSLLTGQEFASSGDIRVFGQSPLENASVLSRTCFIKESQKYPDDFRVKHVLRSAPWFFDGWDEAFARELVEDFRLPVDRKVRKLSRGQLSAIGVVVGLASRAPLTFFDEPYLGLDAVARQLFYDRLLQDFAEHPRTVVLSTHLIDEVSSLLEHVLVIDQGRLVVDSDAEELRGAAATVIGPRQAVESFTAGREVIARSALGSRASATLARLDEAGRASAVRHGLELESVPLQQLVVQLTTGKASE
ncbi:ABC transporter ATP-binding protein [Rathayibacter sp. VKM Ac-2801]|uniref:ABC transporter ATP-binding protein n=1 Tax=Rathayibacter sp. VKM Ac-2801 TaxID=2609255 RepID=UPI00131FB582|nr:ABC transporter ATP-binding protein [Rathayibacter sp. VKM Ac-2801]QHC70982.1 ATP-binding cassette domain-containing protein [Rathayibacter sp. VKM Ac-2801]